MFLKNTEIKKSKHQDEKELGHIICEQTSAICMWFLSFALNILHYCELMSVEAAPVQLYKTQWDRRWKKSSFCLPSPAHQYTL